jgi:hypothetical protein
MYRVYPKPQNELGGLNGVISVIVKVGGFDMALFVGV